MMVRLRFLATLAMIAVSIEHETAHAYCIDRIIVRPVGRITSTDPVRLEIEIDTVSSPPIHMQPTEVSIVGDSVAVRIFVVGGPADTHDSTTEVIELGLLGPQTYHYAIALNPTTDPPTYTANGTFCVEDIACAEAACRCPLQAPRYTIINLGTVPVHPSWGPTINDAGQVTGQWKGPNGSHAFLWDNGTMTDLGVLGPGDTESFGLDINNHGDVVGYSYGSGPLRAVLWSNGQIIDLGTLGLGSGASGINDAGQIVGWSWLSPNESHAFLWQNGELIDLTTTYNAPMAAALDINALGQILWNSIRLEPDGTITELETLGGAGFYATAMNDGGQIVGRSQHADGYWHAFVWDEGEMTDLTAAGPYLWNVVNDINNSGQVVGWGEGTSPWCGAPFLYEPGKGFRDLRDLIPIDSGWATVSPYSINDAGHTAGMGWFQGATGSSRAFLMTIPTTTGSCCANNGSCDTTLLGDCNAPLWLEGMGCAPNSCPPPGTCCINNGTCIMTLEADCGPGTWTEGGLCDPNPCPQYGTCCAIDGSCATTFLADCDSPLWVEGMTCNPNRCPIPPIVTELGSRYLSVTPQAWEPDEMVAVRITSPLFPCLSKYVALDSGIGRVIDSPVFLPIGQWGTVIVADEEIVPATTYNVQAQNALGFSEPVSATTPLWGDLADPFEIVDALDIAGAVNRFKSLPGAPSIESCDLYPAVPDQGVNALDITMVVDAYKGFAYPFPLPCP